MARMILKTCNSYTIDKEVQAMNYDEIDGLKYFHIDTYEILGWMVANPALFRTLLWTTEHHWYYKLYNHEDMRWWCFRSRNPKEVK